MPTLVHPASLNALQQFRQANSLLRETSRATLPAWYQEALELDYQVHVRVDGARIDTFFYNKLKNEWTEGSPLTNSVFSDEEATTAFANHYLNQVRSLKGISLGVVVHLADEFSTAELDPELNNPAALPELREAIYHEPGKILDDTSIPADQASWRVMPYPAAGSEVIGTTISISRRLERFLSQLRNLGDERNFPIITHALSAPLVAIMGLSELIAGGRNKPLVAILQYPWFTAMAFFNEHLDLRLIRTLQHRGLRRPSNFRHSLATTNAALEFVDPDLYVVPLGEDVDTSLVGDLEKSFPESLIKRAEFPTVPPIPAWIPELRLSVEPIPAEEEAGLSHTFGVLKKEKWFLQDFLPAAKEVAELVPTRAEMILLRILKLSRVAVFALAVLAIAWMAFEILSLRRRPEWAFNENDAKMVKMRLVHLTQEQQRIDHWNNLLDDRSKAWTTMEALARLFPANSGMLVKGFNHNVRPDSAPGQAKAGFVKEWTISGMARDGALEYLNALNTREGIAGHFSEIAKVTGNTAFDPEPNTRTIVVNVKTQENSSFRQMPLEDIIDSDEATYPFTFNLSITQRFESADDLAISATKAP